jgi:hypothetical protein
MLGTISKISRLRFSKGIISVFLKIFFIFVSLLKEFELFPFTVIQVAVSQELASRDFIIICVLFFKISIFHCSKTIFVQLVGVLFSAKIVHLTAAVASAV